jgi:LPPG:FO 2-phospho-L-lactate transferase
MTERSAFQAGITVLAGGVGAARFLQGLVRVVPPRDITIVSNTGDDLELFGLHVSPDIDIVVYHLAGLADEERGFGLRGDTFDVVEALERFGYPTWFRLGDRDLATCLHRTRLLAQGCTLSQTTDEIARAFALECTLLPMSDDSIQTLVETTMGMLDFQRYLVERGAQDNVRRIHLPGIKGVRPAPGVLEAIAGAQAVVLAPSNPLVSIGPIMAVPGVREALRQTAARIAAVSPIVGGEVIKGPLARMLRDLGYQVSPVQVAKFYADFLDALVIDNADAYLAQEIRALGLEVAVTDTIMRDVETKAALARAVLVALGVEA